MIIIISYKRNIIVLVIFMYTHKHTHSPYFSHQSFYYASYISIRCLFTWAYLSCQQMLCCSKIEQIIKWKWWRLLREIGEKLLLTNNIIYDGIMFRYDGWNVEIWLKLLFSHFHLCFCYDCVMRDWYRSHGFF